MAFDNKTLNLTEINFLYNSGLPNLGQQYPFTNTTGTLPDFIFLAIVKLIIVSPSEFIIIVI